MFQFFVDVSITFMDLGIFVVRPDFSCFRQVYSCLNLFHSVVVGFLIDAVQEVVFDEAFYGEQVLADSVRMGILC